MKLEVGKFYKTRDGRKAFVAGKLLPNPFRILENDLTLVAVNIEGDNGTWCNEDGLIKGPEFTSSQDLVSEWKEPIKVSGWVNVYGAESEEKCWGPLHASRELADEMGVDRLACIYVQGAEGENEPTKS